MPEYSGFVWFKHCTSRYLPVPAYLGSSNVKIFNVNKMSTLSFSIKFVKLFVLPSFSSLSVVCEMLVLLSSLEKCKEHVLTQLV